MYILKGCINDVYSYFDEVLLFSITDSKNTIFLLMLVDRGVWLAVEVSKERLQQVEGNQVDLRTAYLEPENSRVFLAKRTEGQKDLILTPSDVRLEVVELSGDIPDEYLPEAGVFLINEDGL